MPNIKPASTKRKRFGGTADSVYTIADHLGDFIAIGHAQGLFKISPELQLKINEHDRRKLSRNQHAIQSASGLDGGAM